MMILWIMLIKDEEDLTLHKKYDFNTAILAGDILAAVAYEYLLKDCNGNAKHSGFFHKRIS